jgi:putative membrane protein
MVRIARIAGALLIAAIMGACAPRAYGAMGMEPMLWSWAGMAFDLLGTFLAALFALFVYRWLTGAPKSALEVLKERYAKGEIGKEEFERVKTDLTS